MNKNKLLKILTSTVIGSTFATASVLPFVLTTDDNNAVTTLENTINNEEKVVTEGDVYAFTDWTVTVVGNSGTMSSTAEIAGGSEQTLTLDITIANSTEITITDINGGATSPAYNFSLAFDSVKDSDKNVYTITSIGDSAFRDCEGLTSFAIGVDVKSIGVLAFSGCAKLTGDLIIPGNVESIGRGAFSSCSGLESITIYNGVLDIGATAFYGCFKFTGDLIIPGSVTSIGGDAFGGCNFTNIDLTDNNTYALASNVDSAAQVVVLKTDGDLSKTCDNVVGSLAIGNLVIPDGVESIGGSAFDRCSGLTSVEVPNSVQSIGNGAFADCSGMTSIVLSDSVESIGSSAFLNCSNLTSISWWLNNSNTYTLNNTTVFNTGNTDTKIYTNDKAKFDGIANAPTSLSVQLTANAANKQKEIKVGEEADLATISLNNGQLSNLSYEIDVSLKTTDNDTFTVSEANTFNVTDQGVLHYDGSEIGNGIDPVNDIDIVIEVTDGTSTPIFTEVMTFAYDSDANSLNVGAVVGGTIGAVAGVGTIGGATFYFTKKKAKPVKRKK